MSLVGIICQVANLPINKGGDLCHCEMDMKKDVETEKENKEESIVIQDQGRTSFNEPTIALNSLSFCELTSFRGSTLALK
mgnify:CR=1 FL=1